MKRKHVYHIALTAVLVAMTTVAIFFLRVDLGYGIVHLGDAIILLAAVLLPTPYAMVVGGLGGGMANVLGAGGAIWAPATIIIKSLMTVPFSAKQPELVTPRNLAMLAPYSVITIVGYALYRWLLIGLGTFGAPDGVWVAVVPNLVGDIVQTVGSAVLFIALATVLEKTKFKQRINL
ncbi:MAG: ECF transporter S component [Oscillospiraceae bacterium]|nr:ECF transporter S component [Oscillospiraceae bacterium]